MLSLSPRYDLVRFLLPHDFIPEEVNEKWTKLLNQEPGVLITPLDYLNESIVGVNVPGISDINIQQQQHSSNAIQRRNARGDRLGRINVEPKQDNTYVGSGNPLDHIERVLTVTMRMNQGFYNWFMMLEIIFYRFCKPWLYEQGEDMYIDILDESGTSRARFCLAQCNINGIEDLDLSWNKVDRSEESFQVTFNFNNIDWNILEVPQT